MDFLERRRMEQEKIDWSKYIRTVNDSDYSIISAIIKLHNNGQGFDVDPTYSKGVFWKKLNPPKYKFDLLPQTEDTVQASADNLPLEDGSVGSIMFDPPFIIRNMNGKNNSKIANRFSAFQSTDELLSFYERSLCDFHRVLRDGGIVAFKCQDYTREGKQFLNHVAIVNMAAMIGFEVQDLFVLVRKNVMFSRGMKNQKHARKNHCYYIVLKKRKQRNGKHF